MNLLGRTYAHCLHQPGLEPCKLPVTVDRLSDAKRLDCTALKWIASVPWKEVHVQVRQSVAMNLVVELDCASYDRQRRRDAMRVLNEGHRLSNGQVMQINSMYA